ncbi:hypothetical protein ACHAWF_017658 [Thalassiosira exigua]
MANLFLDGYDLSVCEPMHEHQLQSFPNCNAFHELDLKKMPVLSEGGSRIVFEARQALDNKQMKYVYKIPLFERKFEGKQLLEKVEEQRKDSFVMGRASGSRFIPPVRGYCGMSITMDYMAHGDMHGEVGTHFTLDLNHCRSFDPFQNICIIDYIKGVRLGGRQFSPVDKLKVAFHITRGVADLHTRSSYIHGDVCCHQYLFHKGIFMLNDFNNAEPMLANRETGKQCKVDKKLDHLWVWKGRSLEEFQKFYESKSYSPATPQMVDVWMMGNLIYTLLTNNYTFEKPHLNVKEAAKKLMAGGRSPIPARIRNSKDPSHMAIMNAIDMCWKHDWRERPPARVISNYLFDRIKAITGEDKPDVRVVLPRRDPKQKGTHSDFVFANYDHTDSGDILDNCG